MVCFSHASLAFFYASDVIAVVPLDLFPTGKRDFTHGKSVFCV